MQRLDYLQWLGEFDQLDTIPRETKKTGAYREYVQSLLTYIYEFLAKTRPLLNVAKVNALLCGVMLKMLEPCAGTERVPRTVRARLV